MKKLLVMLLVMGILLSIAVPFSASAETEGDFTYSVENGEATITNYTSNATELTIPGTLGGYPVTAIGEQAFYFFHSLTSVTIPGSVTTIGRMAFYGCEKLTSVTIPDGVTAIWENAFRHCDSLTSVTIPDSVNTIGWGAFSNCDSLTAIYVDGQNKNCCDVDGVLFNKTQTRLFQYPNGKTSATYSIPDSVTTIEWYAFAGCTNLTSVIIPDSVTDIGDWAFDGCENLVSVTIPNSVTTIGTYAFYDCTNLTSITIPDSVTTIGMRAFGLYSDGTDWEDKPIAGFTVRGTAGSVAQTYATNNGLSFQEVTVEQVQQATVAQQDDGDEWPIMPMWAWLAAGGGLLLIILVVVILLVVRSKKRKKAAKASVDSLPMGATAPVTPPTPITSPAPVTPPATPPTAVPPAPVVPQQGVFCGKCGAKNEPNAVFCLNCGAKLYKK